MKFSFYGIDHFHYNFFKSEHLDLPVLHVLLHHAGHPVDEVPVSVGLLRGGVQQPLQGDPPRHPHPHRHRHPRLCGLHPRDALQRLPALQ